MGIGLEHLSGGAMLWKALKGRKFRSRGPYGELPGFEEQGGILNRAIQARMRAGYGQRPLNLMQQMAGRQFRHRLPQMRQEIEWQFARQGTSPSGQMVGRMAGLQRAQNLSMTEAAERIALENELAKERAMASSQGYLGLGGQAYQRQLQGQIFGEKLSFMKQQAAWDLLFKVIGAGTSGVKMAGQT